MTGSMERTLNPIRVEQVVAAAARTTNGTQDTSGQGSAVLTCYAAAAGATLDVVAERADGSVIATFPRMTGPSGDAKFIHGAARYRWVIAGGSVTFGIAEHR